MDQKATYLLQEVQQLNIEAYNYPLPDDRIAKYPLQHRDRSKLLLYRNGEVSESVFDKLPDFLPENSLIVFNDTKVIQARLLFTKETGAQIEIFCLEPEAPRDYALNFQSSGQCQWICLVGNSKRWKEGTLKRAIQIGNKEILLTAERLQTNGHINSIRFKWDSPTDTSDIQTSPPHSFAEILDAAGILPIPPYLHRETEQSDLQTYQTVYSKIKGSVAAPTAGLHFTPEMLHNLEQRGFKREELTLHVSVGTFKPVLSPTIGEHAMHSEFFSISHSTIANLINYIGKTVAVGTTSVRTLESLYYIGAILAANPTASPEMLIVNQWTPYENRLPQITTQEALQHILSYLEKNNQESLITSTQILIAPGYPFHIVNQMITNFHQPKSTLLLLVSAFVKADWQKIYNYALTHNFRFLSYGDTSLLSPPLCPSVPPVPL